MNSFPRGKFYFRNRSNLTLGKTSSMMRKILDYKKNVELLHRVHLLKISSIMMVGLDDKRSSIMRTAIYDEKNLLLQRKGSIIRRGFSGQNAFFL